MVEFLYQFKEYNPISVILVIGFGFIIVALISLINGSNRYYIGSIAFSIGIIMVLSTVYFKSQFYSIELRQTIASETEKVKEHFKEVEDERKSTLINIAEKLNIDVDSVIIVPTEKTNTQVNGTKLYTVYVNDETYIFKIKDTEVVTYSKMD